MTVRLAVSRFSLSQWLGASAFDKTPDQESANVIRVQVGDVVNLRYEGHQTFGSGGYWAEATFAGSEPGCESSDYWDPKSGFTASGDGSFKITGACAVWEYECDNIGRRRVFRYNLYICATDEEIEAARLAVELEWKRAEDAAIAAEAALKKTFARERHSELMSMGYSSSAAGAIMRSAGPGHCVAAAQLAVACKGLVKNPQDALIALYEQLEAPYGRMRRQNGLTASIKGLNNTESGRVFVNCSTAARVNILLRGAITALEAQGVVLPPDPVKELEAAGRQSIGKGRLAEQIHQIQIA